MSNLEWELTESKRREAELQTAIEAVNLSMAHCAALKDWGHADIKPQHVGSRVNQLCHQYEYSVESMVRLSNDNDQLTARVKTLEDAIDALPHFGGAHSAASWCSTCSLKQALAAKEPKGSKLDNAGPWKGPKLGLPVKVRNRGNGGEAKEKEESEALKLAGKIDQSLHEIHQSALSKSKLKSLAESAHADVHDLAALLSDDSEIRKSVLSKRSHCGCCGESINSGEWCKPCAEHISENQNLPPWDRTYFAQHGSTCPFARAGGPK